MRTAQCDRLCALLVQAGDDAQREQDIMEHIAHCTVCTADDVELSLLIARYRSTEPRPLSNDLETRLLDSICVRLHE